MFTDLLALQHHPAVRATGLCDTLQIATKRLIKQWTAATLLAETDASLLAEVPKLAKEARELADERHILVHGFWDYPSPDQSIASKITVIKPSKGGGISFQQYSTDLDDLIATYNRCISLYHRVMAIGMNHGIQSAKWRDLPKIEQPDE